VQVGYAEAFVRELEWFWASVVEGAERRNTVEDAVRDARLLTEIGRRAVGAA
jgi:hypothetical protein